MAQDRSAAAIISAPADGAHCERCGATAPRRARYCSNACRQAAYRERGRNAVTDQIPGQLSLDEAGG